jgi:hypothetical protein
MQMNRLLSFGIAVFIVVASPAIAGAGGPLPKVVVHATAGVDGDNISLGDIADISPSPQTCKASARIAATIVGRAPLPGQTRQLTRGDICLKLRQAGIDPATVDLEGATNLVISQTATESDQDGSASGDPGAPAKPAGPVVKPGDELDIVLVDGPVIARTKAFAITGGYVGDTISVRRDGSERPLTATIIDAGQAELEE